MSFNLNAVQLRYVFKNLLLIAGLIAIFVSVTQQHFAADDAESFGNGKVTVVQFDKDNNRDSGDKAFIGTVVYHQNSEKSSIYYFYSARYQEPTLLVHLKPPKA
ncbi:MAG: hypothetical protein Q8N02_01065 [Methylotenera sp.]|nr:hypothetical protein [Methylotenera sp.]MDO9234338.1 hypothetical protein [Methylotenera sp.]MDO9390049.1 hypothetical protein [Methylotenera sp.]MDP2101225.1 hypothetical protein [Methylotenera sp.]MDP2280931.1 hypothetical protein [Methylotenera sp.]